MDPALFDEMARIEDSHWWFAGRRQIIMNVLRDIDLPRNASLLEIGCGTGGNLPILSTFGRVLAVESDPQARRHAEARGIAPIHAGSLPDNLPIKDSSQDVILLLDVLEHLEDDAGALAATLVKLKLGGAVVIAVPALDLLWSSHDEQHGHLRRYNRARLATAIQHAGLRLERMTYFNFFLLPAMAMLRVGSKLTSGRVRTELGLTIPPDFLNRAFRGLLEMEAALIRNLTLPVGGSLLAVARRP